MSYQLHSKQFTNGKMRWEYQNLVRMHLLCLKFVRNDAMWFEPLLYVRNWQMLENEL